MSATFLTPEELVELTGYKSSRGQAGWLRARSWIFERRRDGSPVVSRAYLLARTGTPTNGEPFATTSPNWSALA